MDITVFIGFNLLVVLLLYLDLFVFNRRNQVVRMPEAVAWSVSWIALRWHSTTFFTCGKGRNWRWSFLQLMCWKNR